MKITHALIVLFLTNSLSAQTPKPSWQVGAAAGSGYIKGELRHKGFGPQLGLFGQVNFGKHFQLGTEYTLIQYLGSDVALPHEREPYKSDIHLQSFSKQLAFYLGWSLIPASIKTNFRLHLFSGFGMASFQSQVRFQDLRDSLGYSNMSPNPNFRHTVYESYDGKHLFIPFGFSLSYLFSEKYYVGMNASCLFLRSDDLDVMNTSITENKYWDRPVNISLRFGISF